MRSKPILIKFDKTGQTLEPIDPSKKQFTEAWLQELIQEHPQILPVDEIEPVFWPLIPIGREVPTDVGPIDNLFISEAGYPVLVETKLWRNSQAKREVIAQALDYAGELSKWSFEELNVLTKKYHKKGIIELIQEKYDTDSERLPSEETIAKNLRFGRFLILIVGDHIRSSLTSMLESINRYPHLATNLGLVELLCYQMPGNLGEIMVVPSIIAKTVIIERSVVQVILEPDQNHKVIVEQTKHQDDKKRIHTILSEEVFWDTLKQKRPESVNPMHAIFDHYYSNPIIYLQMRQSGIVVRMLIPDSDQAVSLLILYMNGNVECWPETIKGQLEKAGLDPKLGDDYQMKLSKVFKGKSKNRSIFSPAEQIKPDELFQIVDGFIEVLSESEPQS